VVIINPNVRFQDIRSGEYVAPPEKLAPMCGSGNAEVAGEMGGAALGVGGGRGIVHLRRSSAA